MRSELVRGGEGDVIAHPPADTEGPVDGDGLDDGVTQVEGLSRQAAEDEEEEVEVRGRVPRCVQAPLRVSQRERDEHELTHTPYRSWCQYCVRGRGRNAAHRKMVEQDAAAVPRVSMDYFYISTADEVAHENPILVMVDESTGERYARAVGRKGLGADGENNWLIRDMSEELRAWGHAGGEAGRLILKSDGERSIVAVRDALAKFHGGRVIPESPPRGESQSNGTVEEAGKTVREYLRVLKEQIEHKAAIQLKGSDNIISWMVRWSAMVYSRFAIGRDGLTAYERRRGRRCTIPTVCFGERIWYKELRQFHDRRDKLDSEWFEGIWLGHSRGSNEHIVGTDSGVIRAYAVKRQPEDRRWNAEMLRNLKGTPQQPRPDQPGSAVPVSVRFDVEEDAAPQEPQPPPQRQIRRMRITETLLQQYGYTVGCEGCRFRRAGLGETRPHTEECRTRVEAALAANEAGRAALEAQRLRLERRRAERAEETQKEPVQEPAPVEAKETSGRAQNTSAGCSHRGARPEDESLSGKGAQDLDMRGPMEPTDRVDEPRLAVSHADGDPDVQRGDVDSDSPMGDRLDGPIGDSSRQRGRSRSPRGPGRVDPVEVDRNSAGRPLEPSREEPEAKRAKPDAGELSMDIGSLRKLVTVDSKTTLHAGQVPTEEPQPVWSGAWDDVTGEQLDPELVREARQAEMHYINGRGVWRKVPKELADRNGWKIIKTRWIDINKGDSTTPNYRSRLVAKEFNDGAQEGLFAATPPLEALRLLLSDAATVGKTQKDRVAMLNDVARAFFEAPMTRQVCVELPPEARVEGEDDSTVGFLKLSLYGTRDAAANFQAEVRKFLLGAGFTQSSYNPQVYHHVTRDLKTIVHGDDFVTSGDREQAKWMEARLAKRFEIKSHIIGRAATDLREHRILGRIVRATADGWEYEADPRHAEIIVREMRLEGANGAKSPGEEPRAWSADDDRVQLSQADARAYRGMAARANYLAQDRGDIAFAAKECCRGMANPTKGDARAMRRLARYLLTAPRVVWRFKFQHQPPSLRVFSDSDWAGCRRTARSTSGGVIMLGEHCIRGYSVTQKHVTLSSAEAELMALVKATSEAIGLCQLAEAWNIRLTADVFVDSSAALAIVHRKGNGKLRHVRIGHLWVQELSEGEEVSFHKVAGESNPADLYTKHLPPGRLEKLTPLVAQFREDGEASSRIKLNACSTRRRKTTVAGNAAQASSDTRSQCSVCRSNSVIFFGHALDHEGPALAKGECMTTRVQ